MRYGHFRRVFDIMKHTFRGEEGASRNPVRSARELVAMPDFQAVCITERMHSLIGRDHRWGEPGIIASFVDSRTSLNHTSEISVARDAKLSGAHRTSQSTRDVKAV